MKNTKDTINFSIIKVARAHRHYAQEALNKFGLHIGQEFLLMQLWQEEGLTQSHLADTMQIEPPTVTKMLQRLEKAGFIERRQDSEDARVSRVYLTEQGRALQEPVLQMWEDLEQFTVANLTEMEQALLRRLLLQVAESLKSNCGNELA